MVALLVDTLGDSADVCTGDHDVAAVEGEIVFGDAVEPDALERGDDRAGVIDCGGLLYGSD